MKPLALILLLCSPAWGQDNSLELREIAKHRALINSYLDSVPRPPGLVLITLADLEGYLAECYADSSAHAELLFRIVWTHRVPTLEGFAQYLRRKQCSR
jgi:hypothetical protein